MAQSSRSTDHTTHTDRIRRIAPTTPVGSAEAQQGVRTLKNKQWPILTIAAALSALAVPPASEAAAPRKVEVGDASVVQLAFSPGMEGANRFLEIDGDVLGFMVTQAADGTVIAQHRSHFSHSSHASHASHYSSRF